MSRLHLPRRAACASGVCMWCRARQRLRSGRSRRVSARSYRSLRVVEAGSESGSGGLVAEPQRRLRTIAERCLGGGLVHLDSAHAHLQPALGRSAIGPPYRCRIRPSRRRGRSPEINRDVAVVGRTEAWAVGDYLSDVTKHKPFAEHWDGRVWTLVPLPRLVSGGYLYAVDGASPDDVWAVGSFVAPKTIKPLILHWDGTSWSVAQHPWSIPGQPLGWYRREAIERCLGGSASGRAPPLVEHWDGHKWRTKIPTPGVGGNFFAVTALGPRRVWAVGQYYRKAEIEPHALASRWTGRTWRFTRPPDRKWFDNTLIAVDGKTGGGV
jgi:hypothetical protein